MTATGIALGAYGAVNLLTFLVYAWDKRRAVRGAWRVSEARLHQLALAGGFVGAVLGMRLLRHKTQKPVFRLVAVLAAVLHVSAWSWWIWSRREGR